MTIAEQLFSWCRDQYGTEVEYLWADLPDCGVLRNPSGKWYGIVMPVRKNRLVGLDGEDMVEVLNVKVSPLMLGSLLEQPGFIPAYHMNKKSWVSILLDGSVDMDTIHTLLELSYDLTTPKKAKAKKMPATD